MSEVRAPGVEQERENESEGEGESEGEVEGEGEGVGCGRSWMTSSSRSIRQPEKEAIVAEPAMSASPVLRPEALSSPASPISDSSSSPSSSKPAAEPDAGVFVRAVVMRGRERRAQATLASMALQQLLRGTHTRRAGQPEQHAPSSPKSSDSSSSSPPPVALRPPPPPIHVHCQCPHAWSQMHTLYDHCL